ncbi:MAG: GHKL domain-containing protein [Deltaproteobacteria bacterium]|nr:GHKL domain-containing protein [Deltaproteobacteria bacterium]
MNLATEKAYDIDQWRVDLPTANANQIDMAVHHVPSYEDFGKRIESLQEKNETFRLFAYSFLHDLRSPAIGIYGLTKNLKDKYGPVLEEKGNKYCDQIMKASEHIVEMVEKVNAYVVAKEAPLVLQKMKMEEVIEALKFEFSSRLMARNITWKDMVVLPEIVADRSAIVRVFRNFIDNALKYGGDGMTEIGVGYNENKDFHIFTFSDDGLGIQKANSEIIFDRFRRMHTSKETAGIGLGLSIVKEIAERHGGRVWMENGMDKWVTFYFSVSKFLKSV